MSFDILKNYDKIKNIIVNRGFKFHSFSKVGGKNRDRFLYDFGDRMIYWIDYDTIDNKWYYWVRNSKEWEEIDSLDKLNSYLKKDGI